MCGIIGYIGNQQAVPILLDGLHKLEYRGYDSAGMCVSENGGLVLVKKEGKVSDLEAFVTLQNIVGTCGIAHTRWATNGEANEVNAHPHMDCNGRIAIVHNGIIENHSDLRKMLQKEGHKIKSETDSELVAHLIEMFYDGDIENAVIKALKLIEGAYALVVLDQAGDKLVAVRKSSTLVLGIGKGENFVTSDVSAVLSHTKRAVYLDDDEIVVLTKDGYSVKNLNGDLVDKEVRQITATVEQSQKNGFKHFMLKEIYEQPRAIENTLRGRVKNGRVKLSIDVESDSLEKITITACGTSMYAAMVGEYLIEKIARIPVEVKLASEFRYIDPVVKKGELVIVVSQSGETADTLAALREAKAKGAKTLGIVNVVSSAIAREVHSGIYLHAGPEKGVASTKAFTCQVVALTLLALHLKQNKNQDISKTLDALVKIPAKIQDVLLQSNQIRKLAEMFKEKKNFLYFGRNSNYPVALEGALKLKEISYIHAEGGSAAELKHGPIALIDEEMPVVIIVPRDDIYDKVKNNVEQIKARKGIIVAITNEDDEDMQRLANFIIKVPKSADELSPLINVVPLQLLAYHIADLKGLDVDQPRNLAKSVTVE